MQCAVLGFVPLGSEKISSHAKQNLGTSWPWFFSTFPQAPLSLYTCMWECPLPGLGHEKCTNDWLFLTLQAVRTYFSLV